MVRVELESTVLARGLVCAELPARKVCTRSNQGFGVSRSQKVSLCPGYELQSLVLHYFMTLLAFLFVYYGWMNSKAKAEGRKCSGYLCYEAERAAACMTLCLPHTLVEVRAGLRAWEVAGWSCTIAITCSEFHKHARRAVDSVGLRSLMDRDVG